MEQVKGYHILHRIKSDRTGVVYLASDRESGREFAIRMVQLDWFSSPGDLAPLRELLRCDILSAQTLCHPSVVKVHDFFEEFGLAWIVMDLVKGKTLEELISGEYPLPKGLLRRTLRQVAECLDYAHRSRVFHMHLRPTNILVQEDGAVRILGFGLARVSTIRGATPRGVPLTAAYYAAPEQIRGDHVDGRSDQFSFGVLVYQVLTGKRPFADDAATMLSRILEEDPVPPENLNPSFGLEVRQALFRGLSKNPDDRYESCIEFMAAVEAALDATPEWIVPLQFQEASEPRAGDSGSPGDGMAASFLLTGARTTGLLPQRQASAPKRFPVPATVIWLMSALLLVGQYAGYKIYIDRTPPRTERSSVPIKAAVPLSVIMGKTYSKPLAVRGGTPPFRWTVSGGRLPPGISLDAQSGVIVGTPTEPGLFQFTVRVTDASQSTASRAFNVTVSSAFAAVNRSALSDDVAGPTHPQGSPHAGRLAARALEGE